MAKLKIKLDNLDSDADDPSVLIICENRTGAIEDQSIAGSHWEAPGDMDIAYAYVVDHPGLLAELQKEGYDCDVTEYCAPSPLTRRSG